MEDLRIIEELHKIYEEEQLIEMALTRSDAIGRCTSLGEEFIIHFDKVYTHPEDNAVNHWKGEMQGWLSSVLKIKLKPNAKHILRGELRDWFFTAGASPEDFMLSPNDEELQKYDDFVESILNGSNVVEAFKKIGIE